ncbi:acyltransferase [Aliivibrio fischeri]|uniref:acyltransferase n=1 Tax=Aliivibrio fischeri TaxID=668 RepID=UPI0012DAD4FA|nr:acyltransferase [Aliivibrio fischeri]MUK65337.1 hypothetical protein [Aliivibrio fischeri]
MVMVIITTVMRAISKMRIRNKIANLINKIYEYIFCYDFFKNPNVKSYGRYVLKNSLNITIKGKVHINDYVYINGLGGVVLGDNVIISAGAKIISTGLLVNKYGFLNEHDNKKIKIGNNVQIGAGAIVLSGVRICSNTIIGAASVVSKDINEPGVYVGAPVRKIRGFIHEE